MLAKAIQCCAEQAGGPCIMMCGMSQDLQVCMANLMEFREENVLKIPLLDSMDNVPIASLTLLEEYALLEEPQVAQATTACLPRCREQVPEPEGTTELEEKVPAATARI